MAVTSERRYPAGIQTFSEIREQSYVYIDKTAFVYRLAHESGEAFFLSRPRRFGKSLLVSTMQSYFEGRKELFEGLEVAALESDWVSYPVFRIDLSTIKTKSVDELRAGLSEALQRLERRFGTDERPHSAAACIRSSSAPTNRVAAVLSCSSMNTTPLCSTLSMSLIYSSRFERSCASFSCRSRRATSTCDLCFLPA